MITHCGKKKHIWCLTICVLEYITELLVNYLQVIFVPEELGRNPSRESIIAIQVSGINVGQGVQAESPYLLRIP
jgi:hypothetical protein